MGCAHASQPKENTRPNPTLHGGAIEIEVRQLFEAEDFTPSNH